MTQSKFANEEEAMGAIISAIGDRELTPEVVLDVSIKCMREDAYYEFPNARPDTVEALLLMFQHFYWDLVKEMDTTEGWTEDDSARIMAETQRFGRCMKRTLQKMNSY